MTDMGLSLDDIIKKSKPSQSTVMRGRGGIRRGVSRGARANGVTRPRPTQGVTDARFKIIQKNREKLTDARDKLAEIAKQSDARLKLDKLRATHLKKADSSIGAISRKTGRNGRISLTTNKIPPLLNHVPSQNYLQPSTRNVAYKPLLPDPHYIVDDMSMDYNDEAYMIDAPPLRRTVSIEYAPTPPPPPPVFNMKPASPYTWVKQPGSNSLRSAIPRKMEPERPREYKVVQRSQMSKYDPPSYRDDWSFGSKFRTILPEGPVEPRYIDPRIHREVGVKSRLDAMPSKPRALGLLSRPKTSGTSSSSVGSSQSTGYRIVVSNLQANVTQEDIKELFEDVGELLVSRLVRPGTAEVIYKTLKDATKAVETYHNRQLDGHPMKCLLVNPRPKNNPTGTAARILEPRRSASSMQPSLGTVHRALFDDIIVKLRPN